MSSTTRILLILLSVLSSSCSRSEDLTLRPDAVLQMSLISHDAEMRLWSLRAATPEYMQLSKWIDDNRSGWRPYLATTRGQGLLVDSGEWRLQFMQTMVLACPAKKGCWYKKIQPDEYQYLLRTQPKLTTYQS